MKSMSVAEAERFYGKFVELSSFQHSVDEAQFVSDITDLVLASLSTHATPAMRAVAEKLVELDLLLNSYVVNGVPK